MAIRKPPPHTYLKTINHIEYLYARKQINGKVYQEVLGRADELTQLLALKARDEFIIRITNGLTSPQRYKPDSISFEIISTDKIDQFPNPTLGQYHAELHSIYKDRDILDQYNRYFRYFKDYIGDEFKLHKITRNQVHDFFINLRDSHKLSPKTLMNIKRSLIAVYNKAIDIGRISDELQNPFKSIPKLKTTLRDRIANKDEEEQLYLQAQSWVIPILVTAFNTGLREENLLSLKWSNVVWDLKAFYVTHAKTYKPGYIPWNTNLQKLMIKLNKSQSSGEYIFLNRRGIPYHKEGDKDSGRNAFRTTFTTTRSKAGLNDFRFHDIRRTVKSRLSSQGVSTDHNDYLLGHVYDGSRKHYIFHNENDIENFRLSFEKLLAYNCPFLNDYLNIKPVDSKSCKRCQIDYESSSNYCSVCGKPLKIKK